MRVNFWIEHDYTWALHAIFPAIGWGEWRAYRHQVQKIIVECLRLYRWDLPYSWHGSSLEVQYTAGKAFPGVYPAFRTDVV